MMKSRGSSDKRSLKCLMRGWLTTPPGCSFLWRWQQHPADQAPPGKMVLRVGQVLQGRQGSPVRLAEKDGRAYQE